MLTGNDLLAAVQTLSSLSEPEEFISDYEHEVEKCYKLAQRLDAFNPEFPGAFTGTPSERIERQLIALGILK